MQIYIRPPRHLAASEPIWPSLFTAHPPRHPLPLGPCLLPPHHPFPLPRIFIININSNIIINIIIIIIIIIITVRILIFALIVNIILCIPFLSPLPYPHSPPSHNAAHPHPPPPAAVSTTAALEGAHIFLWIVSPDPLPRRALAHSKRARPIDRPDSSQITLLRAIPTEFDVHDDASIWEMAHLLAVSRPYFATLPRPPLSASPSAVFRSSKINMILSDPPAPSDPNYLRNFEPEWGSPAYYYWCEPRRQFFAGCAGNGWTTFTMNPTST